MVNEKTKDYYSIAELAKLIGVSRITVFKRIKTGKIQAKKIGRMFVIPKKEVEKILGTALTEEQKRTIDAGVKKAVREYGETLRNLGRK